MAAGPAQSTALFLGIRARFVDIIVSAREHV